MIDLHVHSTYSDGTLTPRQLVDLAISKGLTAFALTDHDTVDGLNEILEYSKDKGIEVIPGIEFSTEYEGKDIHILGYYMDYSSPEFAGYLKDFVDSRINRNIKMCEKLTQHGCPVTMEELMAEYPDSVITRAHFARYLLEKGFVKSREEAFDRFIGDRAPCYIPREKVTPRQAIELILSSGGIPSLAHATLYHMSDERLNKLVRELKEAGLIAIEAVYSTYTAGEEKMIKSLANQYDLLLTGGSDFHGANKPKIDLGTGHGKLCVPDEFLGPLKECLRKYVFTDLDDTLFDSSCVISPALKESIINAVKRGNRVVPTSGRPLRGVLTALRENNLELPDMKIISNNGALVYDCDAGKPIIEFKLSQDDLRVLIEKADQLGIYTHSYDDENIVLKKFTKETEVYTSKVHMQTKIVDDVARALENGAYKLMCISLDDIAVLETFREWIEENMGDRLMPIFSAANYLEVLSKEAGKGNGIKALCKRNHIPVGRTYACGDQENDISMLQAAGCGVAVANALPSVKAVADIVTKNDASHDALKPLFDSL